MKFFLFNLFKWKILKLNQQIIFKLFLLLIILQNNCIISLKCIDCRTLNNGRLICNDPCKGDICVIWFYRIMSIDQIIQGCLVGPDFRDVNFVKNGCTKNRFGAFLCFCNSSDFCNANSHIALKYSPKNSLTFSNNIQCQSSTSATFINQQMVKPLRNNCLSDLCFFTQLNITRNSILESTTSNSIWPGLYSNACYKINTGKKIIIKCTCNKNNNCNNQIPYSN
ncbi:hypothetical protein Mgra_00002235 [Meloidogyne graminicola]|uniref:Uncharacterized protein n=1 Tax=Meloidogyne graminicola TaxID=189291 RepID=A0A8S9ZX78_9BILA|nr:hypothetical protein Mgra_00002235 [Meloidogyne graminicola]